MDVCAQNARAQRSARLHARVDEMWRRGVSLLCVCLFVVVDFSRLLARDVDMCVYVFAFCVSAYVRIYLRARVFLGFSVCVCVCVCHLLQGNTRWHRRAMASCAFIRSFQGQRQIEFQEAAAACCQDITRLAMRVSSYRLPTPRSLCTIALASTCHAIRVRNAFAFGLDAMLACDLITYARAPRASASLSDTDCVDIIIVPESVDLILCTQSPTPTDTPTDQPPNHLTYSLTLSLSSSPPPQMSL